MFLFLCVCVFLSQTKWRKKCVRLYLSFFCQVKMIIYVNHISFASFVYWSVRFEWCSSIESSPFLSKLNRFRIRRKVKMKCTHLFYIQFNLIERKKTAAATTDICIAYNVHGVHFFTYVIEFNLLMITSHFEACIECYVI